MTVFGLLAWTDPAATIPTTSMLIATTTVVSMADACRAPSKTQAAEAAQWLKGDHPLKEPGSLRSVQSGLSTVRRPPSIPGMAERDANVTSYSLLRCGLAVKLAGSQ